MEQENKIYKPKSCEECPVIRIGKEIMTCGVHKKLKANISISKEKYNMWKNCPIDWDK